MIRLGILGCAEIAFRRFMPAVQNVDGIKAVVIAEEYDQSKLDSFVYEYGLETESSFEAILARDDIDSVYIPQPPALHYKWAKRALECGKHVMVEKPSTTCLKETKDLVEEAKEKHLALYENYMFQYHAQVKKIKEIVDSGKLGDLRLIRCSFGFPMRASNDFRYNKALGGGALLDAGGYTIKLATLLLGDTVQVVDSKLNSIDGYEVDIFGDVTLRNEKGISAQLGFGMDNAYQCSVEVWGSKARLSTGRVFTAPSDVETVLTINGIDGLEEIVVERDAHFEHSISTFLEAISDCDKREKLYSEIVLQSSLVDQVQR